MKYILEINIVDFVLQIQHIHGLLFMYGYFMDIRLAQDPVKFAISSELIGDCMRY